MIQFGTASCCFDCRTRSVVLAIGVYCVFSFIVIGFDELFSLWAATQTKHGELFVLKRCNGLDG